MGVLRFIGLVSDSVTVGGERYQRRRLFHVWGGHEAGGDTTFVGHHDWVGAHETLLDTSIQMYAGQEVDPDEPDSAKVSIAYVPSAQLGQGAGWFWITWPRYETSVEETYLMGLDAGADTTTEMLRVTPNDDIRSSGGIYVADGAMHLIYRDWRNAPGDSTRLLYHTVNRGDPLNLQAWTPRSELTWANQSRRAQGASFVASEDSVWAIYPSRDNNDVGAQTGALWFSLGHDVASEVASGDSVTWSGAVYLDRDFLVASGGTLIIEPGTRVIALPTDAANVGRWGDKVELVVDGLLLVNGTLADPVTFTSTVHTQGTWGGIYFRDTPDMSVSRMDYAEVEYPEIGVQIDSLACTLFHPRVTDASLYEIYLEENTRIPETHEWNLDAPTTVTMRAENQGLDHLPVEILVDGALRTRNLSENDERVRFTSTTADSFNADDWTGITIRGMGSGYGIGKIRDAEIAFAKFPLTFFAAESAEVVGTWFHHYLDEAIIDFASNAWIVGNTIWRGEGIDPIAGHLVGKKGIHIVESFGTCRSNEVFHQMERGIWADFGSGWCSVSTQEPTRNLVIAENDVIGDRTQFSTLDARGIEVSWACKEKNVAIDSCNVQGWPAQGIKIRQSADVRVGCNCVKDNYVGVYHTRKNLPLDEPHGSGYSVLNGNLLTVNERANMTTHEAGPANDSPQTAGIYGGDSTHPGNNLLRAFSDAAKNWWLDAAQTRTDRAQSNGWRNENNGALASADSIQWHNEQASEYQTIEITNFLSSAPEPSCQGSWTSVCDVPEPPGSTSSNVRRRQPGDRAGSDVVERSGEETGETVTGAALDQLPGKLALHPPRPNPTRAGVLMQLDVPERDAASITLKVYDVAGRRVRTLVDERLPAGRHEISWDLRDQSGKRVSAGLYFATMEAGEKRVTHRVVVLK